MTCLGLLLWVGLGLWIFLIKAADAVSFGFRGYCWRFDERV